MTTNPSFQLFSSSNDKPSLGLGFLDSSEPPLSPPPPSIEVHSSEDLVPGIYEGGLKLWEGSLDLVKALCTEVQNGHLSFEGKQVLEVGS
ncbi:hypothetical protein CRYUN_Cryun29cG0024300 [Craigia yunnanensis]